MALRTSDPVVVVVVAGKGEREILISLSIYPPRASTHEPSVRFHLSTRLLYSWLSGTYIFGQRGGGGREEDGGVECLTWNVSKIVGPSDRNWKIAERERRRRGEGREGEREEVECRREIFYLTIAAARTGRALRFGGESAGDRIAAGVVLVTLLDRSAITLLSLVDYPVSARSPHFDLK